MSPRLPTYIFIGNLVLTIFLIWLFFGGSSKDISSKEANQAREAEEFPLPMCTRPPRPPTEPLVNPKIPISQLISERRIPQAIIIGAQKSCTTSLSAALAHHKGTARGRTKELHFFDDRYHKINWSAPVDELYEKYLKKFPKLDNTHLFFEATPNYAAGYALERMHRIIPHTRLIYIVRKPSSRSVSQFFMQRDLFEYFPSRVTIEEKWEADVAMLKRCQNGTSLRPCYQLDMPAWRDNMILHSLYSLQLREVLRYYPCDQVLVLCQEEVTMNWREALQKIERFLGLMPDAVALHANFRGKYQKPPQSVYDMMDEFYAPYNRELKAMFPYLNCPWLD